MSKTDTVYYPNDFDNIDYNKENGKGTRECVKIHKESEIQ